MNMYGEERTGANFSHTPHPASPLPATLPTEAAATEARGALRSGISKRATLLFGPANARGRQVSAGAVRRNRSPGGEARYGKGEGGGKEIAFLNKT